MIIILGGTFDPIHNGHLAIAEQCLEQLEVEKLFFMPCKQPVHKNTPGITTEHRLEMLKLAINNNPSLHIDLREINRQSASYAVDSLQSYRNEYAQSPLFFAIGMDSLNQLHTWHQWQRCLSLANFLVFQRPGEQLNPALAVQQYIAQRSPKKNETIDPAGKIYLMKNNQVAISSSEIRTDFKEIGHQYLPKPVADYIKTHQLYQSPPSAC